MKKIKKLVHSFSPKAEFTWLTLTENQDKFLDVFNNLMDEEGNKVFNDLMEKIVKKPEYINLTSEEFADLCKIKESIWSGCAAQSFLSRFFEKYKK
jgi:leucyl aminopeptidase